MKLTLRKRTCLITGLVLAGVFAAWHTVPAVRVAVHRQQMRYWATRERGIDSETVQGVVEFHLFDPSVQYEYHRQQLVKLKSLTQRDYTFQSFKSGSEQWFKFFATVQHSTIPHHAWEIPNRFRGPHFSVWCDARDAPAWDQLVRSHDQSAPFVTR